MPTVLLIPNPPRGKKRPASTKGKPVAKKKKRTSKAKKRGKARRGVVYVPMRSNPPRKRSGGGGGGGFRLGPLKVPGGALAMAAGAGGALIAADLAMTKAAAQWPGADNKGFFTTTAGRATVAAGVGMIGGPLVAKTFKNPKAGVAFAAAALGLAVFGAYSTTDTARKAQAWARGGTTPNPRPSKRGVRGLGYWNPEDTNGMGYWNPGRALAATGNQGDYEAIGDYGSADLNAVSQ